MPEVKETASRSLEDFSGDYGPVAELIAKSWSENKQQSLLYGQSFLESCFQYPGADYSLAPTIYDAGSPIAFVAGFPRRVRFKGQELSILLITLLTVDSAYKKKGYGVMLWSELVSRARKAGFDGMVNYCVVGGSMDTMIMGCCQRLKLPTACVFSVEYLSGLITGTRGEDSTVRDHPATIVDSFLDSASCVGGQESLTRIWTRPEAAWQCLFREGSIATRYANAGRQGVLSGYVAPIMNSKQTQCLFVEDVLWSELNDSERYILLQQFLREARAKGAEMATVPRCGYADLKTFGHAGFFRTRRTVRAYLTVWNGPTPNEMLPGFYLDVL
jgi:GNAT superfamily N-acetyltransferase